MIRAYVLATAVTLAGLFGLVASASAKHQHHPAHTLLGNKIQKDGKHELHKVGEHTVHAHVANRKVVNVTVTHRTKGNVAVKKFKTSKKVVEENTFRRSIGANGGPQMHFVSDRHRREVPSS